jgi:small subunit ribosomal protein S8e
MGITRSSKVKRRATGGRMPIHRKKRKFEMGRQPSMTKLGDQKVVNVRGRGSGYKYRALKLNEGNFMWVSEGVSRKCKILEVLYNASNNELVRTQTLVKNCIVSVDSTPFKFYWYIKYTDVKVNRLPEFKDPKLKEKLDKKKNLRQKEHPKKEYLDKLNHFFDLLNKGKLYACITSRPGQVGKADGYLLEGKELEFYLKKLEKKNK